MNSKQSAKSARTESATTPQEFEKAMAELEHIVARMEQNELSLDESLQQFERGIALTRHCQTALQQAEQKVAILLQKSGIDTNPDLLPFNTDAEEN